jgi:hypothetical protein
MFVEKGSYQNGNFIDLFVESEVAGVQHVNLSSGHVALISRRARDRE